MKLIPYINQQDMNCGAVMWKFNALCQIITHHRPPRGSAPVTPTPRPPSSTQTGFCVWFTTRLTLRGSVLYFSILGGRKHPPKLHLYRWYFQMESISHEERRYIRRMSSGPGIKNGDFSHQFVVFLSKALGINNPTLIEAQLRPRRHIYQAAD